MEKEKFKYFVSYVVNSKIFYNAEYISDKFIDGMDEIKEIESKLKFDEEDTVTIINYRIF